MLLLEHHKFINSQKYCVTCATMQTKISNCCRNTNRVTAPYNCSSVTSSMITTMNGSSLKIARIFMGKCQYLSVRFAKILIDIKIVEKLNTRKNQQLFYKGNMFKNAIKITLYCITTRKAAKGIKNSDGQ